MRIHTLLLSLITPGLLLAQQTVTVSTGASNADQVYYSLHNGVQATEPLAAWDLAFEIIGFTSSIRVNTAKGLSAFETPVSIPDWDLLDTPDEANWIAIHNSEVDWSVGALNHGNDLDQADGINLGWGSYNMITHTIAGTRVYVIVDTQGNYRKLRINSLLGGAFDFTYSDLDGSNEVNATLPKSSFQGKNFGYWSFATSALLDPEPPTTAWELLFTKYIGFVPTAYGLTGVLHNKGIQALQVDGVPTDQADAWSAEYSSEINTIGSDWKSYDMPSSTYLFVQDRTYFVKDLAGNIWKLIFIGYTGGASGEMTFTQEMVSATSVNDAEAMNGQVVVYPNPANAGSVQVLLDLPVSEAIVSIHDLSGKLVHGERLAGITPFTVRTIDASALNAGAYVLRVEHALGSTTSRLIVQ